MIFIWFIYGLAFFILGLVIIVYPKKPSAFKLANHLWLIAGFGILHGINEWLDMFIALEGPFPAAILKFLRIATLSGSFLFLLRFGTKVIAEAKSKYRFLEALPVPLFAVWAFLFLLSEQRLLTGDIASRYLLCVPGTFLTAVGLLLQIPEFKRTKLHVVIRNLRLTAVTFLLYGFLAGIVVKQGAFFPANLLNYDLFIDGLGIPVQVFRALCAVILAYTTTQILSIFRWETREALRGSEQRCSTIASSAPIILFVLDRNSVITFIQGRGLELLGLNADDIVGRRISDAFPSTQQFAEDNRRALSGEELVSTVTIEGSTFECCYSPLQDREGEVTGVIGAALDITPIIQAQSKLDQYRREVEKSSRLAEIGAMGSTMAQQLDGPLAVTRLLLQRLQSTLTRTSSDEAISDSLKRSLIEISRACEIVERFRQTAQIPEKTVAGPVDLYQIAKRMMEVFAQSAQRANLKIAIKDIDVVPHTSLSVRELEQIFYILIQNAIDAADIDKKQKLTISCHTDTEQIELWFSDTCGGIEPEELQHIFKPFFTTELNAKGTGLGLTIAKQIICAHGGKITAKSQVGKGITVYVTLPIEQTN